MKSTFSRTFAMVAAMLLVAFLVIGIGFQLLAKKYLVDTAVEALANDARVISRLVQSIYSDDRVSPRDFGME